MRRTETPRLQRWLGESRLDRFALYVENNLGALAGNFWLWLASWRRVAHGGILANPARKHNQSGHIGVTTRLRC